MLNQLLQHEGVRLPVVDMSLPELARMLRYFLSGPGGFVSSRAFWEEQQPSIGLWTSGLTDTGKTLFKRYCQDPRLQHQTDLWVLFFHFFNNRGVVDDWQVKGDSRIIQRASKTMAVADGSFNFPYG
jgi:hypothetical protein